MSAESEFGTIEFSNTRLLVGLLELSNYVSLVKSEGTQQLLLSPSPGMEGSLQQWWQIEQYNRAHSS